MNNLSHLTALYYHACDDHRHSVNESVALRAIRLVLALAVRLTGAQGAMVASVAGNRHTPLVSVDLSPSLAAAAARQLCKSRMPEPGASVRLLQFRHRSPMFAICIFAPEASMLVSFLMTEVNLLDRYSMAEFERLAEDLASLAEPTASDVSAARFGDTPLPTCCVCQNVQSNEGRWMPWARYLQDAEGRMLSHTFCPQCLESHYPDLIG